MSLHYLVRLLVACAALFATSLHADLVKTIAQVKPSVVIVGTYKVTNSPRFSLRGTGFVLAEGNSPDSNLVVTNAHVLQRPAEEDTEAALVVQVRKGLTDLQMRAVTVLEVDSLHDLALLRFDGPAVPGLVLRNSDTCLLYTSPSPRD